MCENNHTMQIITLTSSELGSTPLISDSVLIFMPFIEPMQAKRTAEALSRRANSPGTIVCIFDEKKEGFIHLVNRAFKLSQSPYVGYLAEDAFPGRAWLKIGLDKLLSTKGALLGFNDGKWHGHLAGFGLVDRVWAEQNYQGDLFYPSYHKHYADTELTLLAKSDGVYAYDPDSVLIEVDWEKDQKSTYPADKKLFQARAQTGFDGKVTDPQWLEMFS
jgi:hypothetical protein